MKITLIIPARFASTRFPGKPLVKIMGKPMIQRVYEQTSLAANVDAVYVATDDLQIKNFIESIGGNVIMTEKELNSGTDRVAQAATILGLAAEDIILNIQGDQPFIDPKSVEYLAQIFIDDPKVEMGTLACLIHDKEQLNNPNHVKVLFDNDYNALYFSRACIPFSRDSLVDYPVYKHIGVYGYTNKFVQQFSKLPLGKLENLEKLEQLRALENGYKIRIAVTDIDSPEIDVPEDLIRCEKLLGKSK